MLVKYVKEDNKAYWLLLSDVPEPNQDHETFTIRIPKQNELESIDWDEIYRYVKAITDKKLSARQRNIFGRNNV